MRVMFSVFPSTAHFLPVVPLAWALQSAGHEVCIASAAGISTGVALGDFHKSVTGAGLTAVSCGVPEPLAVHDSDGSSWLPTMAESDHYARILGLSETERPIFDMFYHFMLTTIKNYHSDKPRQDVEAVIEFARSWQPDLVLWDPWFPCGGIAARVVGAAHARVLVAQDYTGWALEKFVERLGQPGGGLPDNPLTESLRPLAERFGCEVDDELLLGHCTLDPMPVGYAVPTTTIARVPVRAVPYSAAGLMPEWLYTRTTDRPRIAISLGVSTRMFFKGDWGRTPMFIEAVGDLDVDVIATLNQNQLQNVGPLPDNVRAIEYVPLTQLLPTCSAIIHHGGPGTLVAACAMNVPQLVADTDEPARVTARATDDGLEWTLHCEKQVTASFSAGFVVDRGAGLRLNHQVQSPQEMRADILRVIEDPSFRAGAQRVHDEWLATPSPADLVPELENLTAQHRIG